MKGREEGNFHLRRTRDDVRPDPASCADCTRERYRPTSDAASARHSYDRISNTAARLHGLCGMVQLASSACCLMIE